MDSGVKRYFLRRAMLSIVVLLGVTVITFTIARLLPSDPAARWVGPRATPEQVEKARVELGLNEPLHIQYLRYISNVFQGNLGVSIRTHSPVLQDIMTFLPSSLELIISGIIIALIVGIPLGVVSATKKETILDHLSRIFSIVGVSTPAFWLGIMLQLLFFKQLGILPLGGRLDINVELNRITGFYVVDSLISGNWIAFQSALTHLILPALTMAAYPIGLVTRMIRATMSEVLDEDYIRTAKAYGVPERTIHYVYALKNSAGPMIMVLALSFAYSLTETFLIEAVFNWPGLGYYASTAILSADFPAIVGITIFMSIFYIIINFTVDIIQAILDPRIRLG
ncbi:MAG: ABC transporter permease [Candidatus Bathyarchaeia archaeon]